MTARIACPSCGTWVAGRFCGNCGEKRLGSHDFSVRHYFEEAVDVLAHFDSKLLKSGWLLLRRPGLLSTEYLLGRRVGYISPLRLFLFISVIYFISLTALHSDSVPKPSSTQFNTFTTPLAIQLHGNDFYGDYAARRVDRSMAREKMDYPTLERLYDQKTGVYSKTLVFLLIPVIAVLLYLLFFTKRRFFLEHLVIATHFWSFALILIGVLLPIVVVPAVWLSAKMGMSTASLLSDAVISYALQCVLGVYLFFMLRRVYVSSRWYSAVIAISMAWCFFFIIWLFRFFLFEVTLRTI
jgi:uncharacterized protein DUF3667